MKLLLTPLLTFWLRDLTLWNILLLYWCCVDSQAVKKMLFALISINTFIFNQYLSFSLILSQNNRFLSGKKSSVVIIVSCCRQSPLVCGWPFGFYSSFFLWLSFIAKTMQLRLSNALQEWCPVCLCTLHTTIGVRYNVFVGCITILRLDRWATIGNQSASAVVALVGRHKNTNDVFNFIKCKWKKRVICLANNAHTTAI